MIVGLTLNSVFNVVLVFILAKVNQLNDEERHKIESRLANYNIPSQILEMVAESCGCKMEFGSIRRRTNLAARLSKLNGQSIIDCFSIFRLATYFSSIYNPKSYKFAMEKDVCGKSGTKYTFDVCIYERNTEDLIAVGVHNKNIEKAADSKCLQRFLTSIKDICTIEKHMQRMYFVSSYGYENINSAQLIKSQSMDDIEVRFLEYKDKIYFECKSLR
ncbi:MAG: hypothetical protein K0S67_430 [Nitrososphaeraceae archaeon]|nr:hypothetical protein [Nitrososphaeraceae archaeon]